MGECAIGGSSLWKNSDVDAGFQLLMDFFINGSRMASTATPQENRVMVGCQPTDDWPLPHLGLSNEGGGNHGIDHKNINPRDMVSHQ